MRSVDIWAIQTCHEQDTFSRSWNISVHNWIKYYIFIRLMDKTKRTFQLIPFFASFMILALWHGTSPGLFVFNLGTFALDLFFKNMKKVRCPEYLECVPAPVWKAISFVFLHFHISYVGMPFIWKTYERYNVMHTAFGHWPSYVLSLCVVGSFVLAKALPKQKDSHKVK